MLRKVTDRKKITLLITMIALCLAIGALILYCSRGFDIKKGTEQTEQPYDGDGLKETDEKEDAVDSIPWSDSVGQDKDESSNQKEKPSAKPDKDEEQNTNDEGELEEGILEEDILEEDILDDNKTWGNNIS